ncbi:MAG: hypothetical protein GX754_07960 [Clostridiaceae bacterium]|nr:hypothetical protein [Clostridiaceae bacterium]
MHIKINKLNVPILILIILINAALLLVSCSQSRQGVLGENQDIPAGIQNADSHDEETENSKDLYDYNLLYTYKKISLSDSDKMQKLVSLLQYARELQVDQIIVVEGEESLRIDYFLNLSPGQQYKVDHTKMMADVVILFGLMDKLIAVEYNLVQGGYSYGGVPITREQAEHVIGANIELLCKTEEVFLSEMPQIIANLEWDPDVMDTITYEHVVS